MDYYFEDFEVGQKYETEERFVRSKLVKDFIRNPSFKLTNPMFSDIDAAKKVGYKECTTPSPVIWAMLASMIAEHDIYSHAILEKLDLEFKNPVYHDSNLRAELEVTSTDAEPKGKSKKIGIVALSLKYFTQKDESDWILAGTGVNVLTVAKRSYKS